MRNDAQRTYPSEKPPTAETGDGPASRPRLSRTWWLALAGLLLLGAIQQGLILWQDWHHDLLSRVPLLDAEEYWLWAERIANGQWVGDLPFMSAPLYPYLLGLLRALGGGLLAVFVIQAILRLTTAALVAYVAARRFAPAIGLLAGALLLALVEPAYFADRVLNCTLQLFLAAVLYLTLSRVQQRPTFGRYVVCGLVLGLNCLANPPMLLAIGLCALWAWWQEGWKGRGLARVAGMVLAAAVTIAPATLHNYKACGEIIPISAQAGVTFAEGNNAHAIGTFTNIAGVSGNRSTQNIEALQYYRHVTGEQGGWNATNRFFFRQGLRFWREHPGQALRLLQVKLYWFVTGRVFGDIYNPTAEQEQGILPRLALAPLPLAWIMPAALLAWLVALRKGRRYGPELILLFVPLIVVAAFWYSPRYRFPVTVVAVVMAASAVWEALHWRRDQVWSLAVVAALAIGVYFTHANERSGFDAVRTWRAFVHNALGVAHSKQKDADAALREYQAALACSPDDFGTLDNVARLLGVRGDWEGALTHYRHMTEVNPERPEGWAETGRVLTILGRYDEALAALRKAVQSSPQTPRYHALLGEALRDAGQPAEAATELREAVRLARRSGQAAEAQRYELLLRAVDGAAPNTPVP